MSFGANIDRPFDAETLAVATYRHTVPVDKFSDIVFQWVLPGVPGGSQLASIEFYASPDLVGKKQLVDIDPATNPFWTEQTSKGAIFPSLPGESKTSDDLQVNCNAHATILIVFTVTGTLTDFSFQSRGQDRT